MAVSTENKLLTNYGSKLTSGRLENSLLERYSSSLPRSSKPTNVQTPKPLKSRTKNALLEKLSIDIGKKGGSPKLENALLKGLSKNDLKGTWGRGTFKCAPLSTENKLLKASELHGNLSRSNRANLEGNLGGIASPRQFLSSPLLEKYKSTSLDLKSLNGSLSLRSGLKLRTKSSLLAPSFSLGRSAGAAPTDTSEKVHRFEDKQKIVFTTETNVEPLCADDFVNIAPLGGDDIKFPTPDEVRQTFETPWSPLTTMKTDFIECVCTALINNPMWFSETDATRTKLFAISEHVANADPEFVLKIALYTRAELNIRTTCNFLLAVASLLPPCRKFLKKYYEKAIFLPSDWIQVAEFYQSLDEPSGEKNNPSLPSALRKVMVSKFPKFDEYQLAKYNKDKSKKDKKKAKKKDEKEKEKGGKSRSEEINEENKEEEKEQKVRAHIPSFTLKFLIRKLHIMKPAYPVMCILGKKYPGSVDDFYKCGLEGTWNSVLAGKRMKLAVPETWETQVSAKGNLAKTWQDLLDHRKLPFMAMLRNLRNMIQAGISDTHHTRVLKTLTNERAVTRSRQFPFRFFSAYEILSELEREIEKQENYKKFGLRYFLNRNMKVLMGRDFGDGVPKTDEAKKLDFIRKRVHKKYSQPFAYDIDLIEKYRKALDEAVRIATVNNVPPIPGHTVVICDVTQQMLSKKCTTSKGIGSSRTLAEVGILLGLMCAYSCEACTFLICARSKYRIIELEKGGILENLKRILSLANLIDIGGTGTRFLPQKYLDKILLERMKTDNILVLSSALPADEEENLRMFLERYKDNVNSKIACFEVDLAGKRPSMTNEPGMVKFSGYSEQILKFIALGSANAQVNFVDTIDLRHNLAVIDESNVVMEKNHSIIMPVPTPAPWRTVRVFISSTIKDMGCERDALVQRVFPILRERAKGLRLHVIETDLRWGITGEDSRYNRSVSICLREVRNCDLFLGILGERYGWVPKDYGFSEEGSEWLEEYPKGRSITELEIVQAAFQDNVENKPCYFYFRESSEIEKELPKIFRNQFFEQNSQRRNKLKGLKSRILNSGHRVADPYHPKWAGVANGSPRLADLEEFENVVLNDLWDAVRNFEKDEKDASRTSSASSFAAVQQRDEHDDFAAEQPFVARGMLFAGIMRKITLKRASDGSIIALVGKSGSGKTALLARLYQNLTTDGDNKIVCAHFAHFNIQDAQSPVNMLHRLCTAISESLTTEEILRLNTQGDVEELLGVYLKLLRKLQDHSTTSPAIFLLVDDLDSFPNIDWLSKLLCDNVTIIVTCLDLGPTHKALKHIDDVSFHPVTDLSISDKREIVRSALGKHSKKLDESHFNNQLQVLLSKQQSTSPLYLTNACDLMRTEETYDTLGQTLKKLPHDLHGTLKWQLKRVETKFSSHPGVVNVIFGLIFSSTKWKISENDLYDAICLKYGDTTEVDKKPLSRALIYHILNSVRSFLVYVDTECGKMLSISHNVHLTVLDELYFSNEALLKSCHATLADFFTLKLKENLTSTEESDAYAVMDALSRIPTHLAIAGRQKILRNMLADLNYAYYKCKIGLGMTLLEDFPLLGEENEKKLGIGKKKGIIKKTLEPAQEMHKFVKSCIHVISRYPDMIFQEALNQPKESYPYVIATEILAHCEFEENSKLIFFEKDLQNGLESHRIQTYDDLSVNDSRTCIATHSKSDAIAYGSLSGKVGLLEKTSGKERNIWAGHIAEVTAVCFIDKTALLSASADGKMSVWNVADGYKVTAFKAHERKVTGIVVRPLRQGTSARIFVSASHDNSIAIWSFTKFKFVARIQTGSPVNCINFHPNAPRVVAGLWDASIRIWDVQTSKRIAVIRGHTQAVSSIQYSLCGNYIASCSQFESIVHLWAASSGIPLGNFSEAYLTSPKTLTFSKEGDYLVGAGEGTCESIAQITVWNSRLGCEEMEYRVRDVEEYGNALCCKFNNAKTSLAVGFHEGYISIFDSRLPNATMSKKIHSPAITCVAWTPGTNDDGSLFTGLFEPQFAPEYILSGSADHTLKALDLESQSVVAILEGHTGPVLCVDATSSWIASGAEDFSILLWRTEELDTLEMQAQSMFGNLAQTNTSNNFSRGPKIVKPVRAYHAHDGPVSCVAFNPAGSLLVSGGRDGKLAYWGMTDSGNLQNSNVQTQQRSVSIDQSKEVSPIFTVTNAHMDWITCCSWNDSSDHIVTGSNDSTLKIWKVPYMMLSYGNDEHKVPVYILKGHSSGIASVVYKMGCIASAGGEDNTIRIWSHKGVEITNLQAESRTNCCDIALRVADQDEDPSDPFQIDEEDNTVLDWADEVATEEWKEEHHKRKPGSKMKRKTLTSEMQNINVVCAGNDAKVTLWKPLAGKKINIMNEQAKSITQLQVSGQGEIISRSSDGQLKLWDITASSGLQRHNGEVTGIVVFENMLVTTCGAGFVYIWEIEDDGRFKLTNKAKIHPKRITALCALTKSVFANLFATASLDRDVIIWAVALGEDTKTGKLRPMNVRESQKTHFESAVVSLTVEKSSENDLKLWAGHVDGTCSEVPVTPSVNEDKTQTGLKKVPKHHLVVGHVSVKNVGPTFISDKGFITGCENVMLEHSEFVHCYVLADGISSAKTLLLGTSRGFICGTSPVTIWKMHQKRVTAILDSEKYLLTASHDCTIKIWSKPDLKQIGQYYTSSPVTCAQFLSESSLLYGDASGMMNVLKLHHIV